MQIEINGKRNITLDFNAPKKFRLVKDGAEIPYIRTGKNSFRLSKPVDGFVELEEIVEQPRYMQPVQLQPQQMTVINPQDVDRLNEAVRQMALVNPQDVMIINQTAEQLEKNQNFISQTQKEITDNQVYIDQQQQRLNETALGVQALETDNSQRLDGAENAILNLAGEISNVQNMAVDGMNTALNKIEEQGILLQAEIDTKADKDELESLKKDFEEKSDRISSAMANYSGGTAYDTLPQGGEAGQILAKRTDRQGDYVWIDQTPVIVKSETIPTASEKYKGEVYQYVGETGDYTHGYIYECQQNGTSYNWVRIDVQPNTAVWGQITGTLSDQTDLQEAFDDKQDKLTQTQMDAVNSGANQSNIAQISVNTGNITTLSQTKQDTLVSGTNIKTINGSSVLGSGDLSVTAQIAWGSITGTLSNQTDLQNALNAKQDVATAVNYDNISNCITEIPQDIKLELNNGTLTLKAGSKVYVPNGVGVFDPVTVSNDITVSPNNGEKLFFLHPNGTQIYHGDTQSQMYSGSSQPSISYGFWYDTTNNVVKFTSNGSTWISGFSLPIAKGSNTSIDQVFNGFGYIGSTVFALPGVKGLIPNGRNADGTLKNTEFTLNGVQTVSLTTQTFTNRNFVLRNGDMGFSSVVYYDAVNNTNYDFSAYMIAATGSVSSGKITSFTPKTAFHAVDYNDFSDLKDDVDNTVKLTGNQTIAGEKTFNNIIRGNRSDTTSYFAQFKNTSIATNGTTPSTLTIETMEFTANDGSRVGHLRGIQNTDGSYTMDILVNSKVSGTSKTSSIAVGIDATGNLFTRAPTPATSDNSTQIATTAFVVNVLKALYPVGSVYITTDNTCPLSTLISGSTWTLVSSGIVKAGDIPCKGNGMTLGINDGTNNFGFFSSSTSNYAMVSYATAAYGTNTGTSQSDVLQVNRFHTLGLTTDGSKSGIIADTSSLTLSVNIFERTA